MRHDRLIRDLRLEGYQPRLRYLRGEHHEEILRETHGIHLHICGPSRKRCRSPVDSVPLSMPVTGSLAPTRADHLPPRKRFRDSYSSEASLEEDAEVGLTETGVDMGLGIGDGDVVGDRVGIDHRDATDDTEEYEADASTGGTAEAGIDPMTAPLVEEEVVEPAGEGSPDLPVTRDGIDRIVGIETAQGRLEADQLIASGDRARMAEAIYSLRLENLKIRAMLDIERDRVSSLRLHMSLSQEEFRQVRRDRDDARGRLRRTMTNTRSGMTHAAIEEMINQRVNAALEAHQVNQNLALGNNNGNGNGNNNGNGNGNNNGNGNGNNNGNGNGNNNGMTMENEMRIQKMETELWESVVKQCIARLHQEVSKELTMITLQDLQDDVRIYKQLMDQKRHSTPTNDRIMRGQNGASAFVADGNNEVRKMSSPHPGELSFVLFKKKDGYFSYVYLSTTRGLNKLSVRNKSRYPTPENQNDLFESITRVKCVLKNDLRSGFTTELRVRDKDIHKRRRVRTRYGHYEFRAYTNLSKDSLRFPSYDKLTQKSSKLSLGVKRRKTAFQTLKQSVHYCDETAAIPVDEIHFDEKLKSVKEPVGLWTRIVKSLKTNVAYYRIRYVGSHEESPSILGNTTLEGPESEEIVMTSRADRRTYCLGPADTTPLYKKGTRASRDGILLENVKAKRLKTSDVSAQEQQESDNQDEIINLQQWAVLVREETSVNITPSVVKVPICDWKIYKDKLREVYQIFRVGQAPKVYPYFESMLKDFDRDDLVTLWKLVKDRFKTELPKSDLEKCLFWPLKVMFEPVATDLLWQFEAPIKSWKMYKSCKVHCLSMEGMIIYMLDDVEYPFQKTTLKKMLDHKCEVSEFNEDVIQMINLIRGQLKKE
ncbi:hypothetical protein Tco_1427416 [Tanacetum coccineum]